MARTGNDLKNYSFTGAYIGCGLPVRSRETDKVSSGPAVKL